MSRAEVAQWAPAAPSARVRQPARRPWRNVRLTAVACAGLFIVLGPAPGQVFGRHSPFLREWVMFSGSGVGVLKGTFTLRRTDGSASDLKPLDLLGLERYPSAPPDEFGRLVLDDGDLRAYAAPTCGRPEVARLSFHGAVGTRQGWRPIEAADLCDPPAPTLRTTPDGR